MRGIPCDLDISGASAAVGLKEIVADFFVSPILISALEAIGSNKPDLRSSRGRP